MGPEPNSPVPVASFLRILLTTGRIVISDIGISRVDSVGTARDRARVPRLRR